MTVVFGNLFMNVCVRLHSCIMILLKNTFQVIFLIYGALLVFCLDYLWQKCKILILNNIIL